MSAFPASLHYFPSQFTLLYFLRGVFQTFSSLLKYPVIPNPTSLSIDDPIVIQQRRKKHSQWNNPNLSSVKSTNLPGFGSIHSAFPPVKIDELSPLYLRLTPLPLCAGGHFLSPTNGCCFARVFSPQQLSPLQQILPFFINILICSNIFHGIKVKFPLDPIFPSSSAPLLFLLSTSLL